MLPRRIPKAPKRASRWRSQAHCNFVRGHECCVPGCGGRPIDVAHVRVGSGAGIGQKPDDWNTVSLCREHHTEQHNGGEPSFWNRYYASTGQTVTQLIAEFIKASPKRHEIEQVQRERQSSPREPGFANNDPGSLA